MTESSGGDSAERAQREAQEMGATVEDEQAAEERFEQTGEPERDKLGNQEGAS